MAALDAVVVGYREHDRRRLRLIDEHGVAFVKVRDCVAGCGYPVYFNLSAMDKLGEGAEVVCEQCSVRYMNVPGGIRDAL